MSGGGSSPRWKMINIRTDFLPLKSIKTASLEEGRGLCAVSESCQNDQNWA
jgi:hypothetical protein